MTQLMELTDVQDMNIDDKQRELYKIHAASIEKEGKAVLAGCTTKEGVERAAAWRLKKREFVDTIKTGVLGMAKSLFYKKYKDLDAEIDGYTEPVEQWMKKVKAKMDAWYLEERERVRLAAEKAKQKDIAKAEEKQAQQAQLFMDAGKPKQAMVVAQKPLAIPTRTVEMPKIKGAVWKKKYVVQIDDVGAVLAYIAKNPKYHRLIDQEVLRCRLEGLATDLAGNMQEFKGIQCFETANSAVVGGPK